MSAPETPLGIPLGIHYGVPDSVYHAPQEGVISKSALDQVARSPAHYRHWLACGVEETPAMALGKAAHCAILEPDIFADRYVERPYWGDMRLKQNKQAKAAWEAEALLPGVTALAGADMAAIRGMQASVMAHPLAAPMLRGGSSEVTVTYQDAETRLYGQSRADYYVPDRGLVVDLKTASDASFDAFRSTVARWRYHVQNALYRAAFAAADAPVEHFVFVVVEKVPPFAVAVYCLDTHAVRAGYLAARTDIQTLSDCLTADEWPAYPATIREIDLPPWAAGA